MEIGFASLLRLYDFILVNDCRKQWTNVLDQFLYINGVVTGAKSPHILFPVQWLLMEQMTFMEAYMHKYKRYVHQSLEQMEIER